MRPELYHTHHKNYIEDLPYWITLADQTDGPILELGCGTGRVILPFYQEGFRIFGLDYDLQMLAYLKQQEPALPVFAADLTRFHLGMKFSFILLTCNTYSTLSSVQRKAA